MSSSRTRSGRRILTALATIALVSLGAVGCGSSGGGGGSGDYKMVVITSVAGDDFHYTLGKGAQEAGRALGVDVEVQHPPKFEAASQVPILNAAITKNPDAIIIDPVDANALQTPLERAADRGIKIVLVDATIEDPSIAETFVSSDVEEAGRAVARELARVTGERGKVAYLDVLPGQTFFENLRKGFEEQIAEYRDIDVLPIQYDNFEEAKANSIIRTTLTTNPDLAGAFAIGSPPISGMVAGLKEADKLDQVRLVLFDGYASNIQSLKDGDVQAVVSTKTREYGSAAVKAAVDALKGKRVPDTIDPGICVLTADNVDAPENSACIYEKAAN